MKKRHLICVFITFIFVGYSVIFTLKGFICVHLLNQTYVFQRNLIKMQVILSVPIPSSVLGAKILLSISPTASESADGPDALSIYSCIA